MLAHQRPDSERGAALQGGADVSNAKKANVGDDGGELDDSVALQEATTTFDVASAEGVAAVTVGVIVGISICVCGCLGCVCLRCNP